MFKLNNLASPLGSKQAKKRKGKGIGSGLGKTAGKGHKGQRARTGHGVGHWFEGGQTPLIRRLPKIGFRSDLKNNRVSVNLTELGQYTGQDLTLKSVVSKTKRTRTRLFVAIVGTKSPKTFPKSVEAHKVAPKAKELLEKAGVKIIILPYKDGAYSTRKPKA